MEKSNNVPKVLDCCFNESLNFVLQPSVLRDNIILSSDSTWFRQRPLIILRLNNRGQDDDKPWLTAV